MKTPRPTADATPTPQPTVVVLIEGLPLIVQGGQLSLVSGDHVDADVALVTTGLDRSKCTLTHGVIPDKPGVKATTVNLQPMPDQTVPLIDGQHSFIATCPSSAGTLTSRNNVMAADHQPEKCLGYDFPTSEITASSLQDLADGIVGTWTGCVTTPWLPVYWVTMTFRSDGTYSATSGEILDAQAMVAMYYGTDDDSSRKVYSLDDLQANGKGRGTIDIDFGLGSVNRDELRNVALMGDDLQFEYWHQGTYGPLTFRLKRS
jgi:hypothetical protein